MVVSAGLGIGFLPLVLASIIGRTARFMLIAGIVRHRRDNKIAGLLTVLPLFLSSVLEHCNMIKPRLSEHEKMVKLLSLGSLFMIGAALSLNMLWGFILTNVLGNVSRIILSSGLLLLVSFPRREYIHDLCLG